MAPASSFAANLDNAGIFHRILTSLEQNSLAKTFQPCCLNDLISNLTEEFLELAVASQLELNWQISPLEIYLPAKCPREIFTAIVRTY